MTEKCTLVLFMVQALSLMLVKAMLLAKYFIFIKFSSPDWKVLHLFYFPPKAIAISSSMQCAKAKLVQNQLSVYVAMLILLVVFIENLID